MGWLFTHGQTRKGLIANRTATDSWTNEKTCATFVSTCLAHCWKGNVTHSGRLWYVREIKQTSGEPARPPERFIGLDLCEYQSGYGWGYKDLKESCGPIEIDCPIKYLDMTDPAPNYGAEWRAKVRLHAAAKAAGTKAYHSAKPGDLLLLRPNLTVKRVTVTRVDGAGPKRRVYGADPDFQTYRIKASMVRRNAGPMAADTPEAAEAERQELAAWTEENAYPYTVTA